MRTYILKRLLLIVPTLLGVASLVFVIMRVIPGDVALLILGGDSGQVDQKQLAAVRQQLGLDQPLVVQFGTWLWGVLRFDFSAATGLKSPPRARVMLKASLSPIISTPSLWSRPRSLTLIIPLPYAYHQRTFEIERNSSSRPLVGAGELDSRSCCRKTRGQHRAPTLSDHAALVLDLHG